MPRSGYPVQIPNVRALSRGVSLVCEIKGRRVAVALNEIEQTSSVQKPGDVGTLVINSDAARRMGLMV